MNENKTNINWYPGHMAKTKREIKERIDLIDIVFEVIDARIPYSSKNKDIDSLIKNKPRILIMTKIDLCDMEITNKWKEYYEEVGYKVILVDLMRNINVNKIFDAVKELTSDLNKKRESKGLKPRRIRTLIVGIPNVGKSTLINRLVGKKATNVGNKPGVTKSLEWIRINDKLELLDTPGILWPKLDEPEVALNLASMTAIKEEILNLDEISIYIINKLLQEYPSVIKDRYKITDQKNLIEILDTIAKHIGSFRNNEADYDKVYLTIFRDLREGRLGKVTFDKR